MRSLPHRERAPGAPHHLGGEAAVVGVRMGDDEQLEIVRIGAGLTERDLHRVPSWREARAAIDENPAVCSGQQVRVGGGD